MIDNNSANRNRFINGILIVVAVALLAASIYSVYLAWRTGLAQSRAETASRLMAIRTSPRSTETPGINAWVSWSLLHSELTGATNENDHLREFVTPRSGDQFPLEFEGILNVLRTPIPAKTDPVEIRSDSVNGALNKNELEFRDVHYVENQKRLFVLTARKDSNVQASLDDFSSRASTHMLQISREWERNTSLPNLSRFNKIRSARVARFYVLSEDESLISLPIAHSDSGKTTSEESLYTSESEEFRKNPLSPSFVSNNFFFRFQFDRPLNEQATFSGMYLDLGGLGLVASVMTPVIYNGKRSVLGADIAFDMDWEEFARNMSPNLISHVTHIRDADSRGWNPWQEYLKDLPNNQPELRDALSDLAERESLNPLPSARKSVYLATTRSGGDLMAIQVNRSTWLLLLVAANEIKLPWTTMLLTSLVFLSLLFRIEQSRRRAVSAQKTAKGEMQEKQNLLETMQVPLMVVDPNTDQVVYCNRAAEAIGMSQDDYFGKDIVSKSTDAQDHYQKTQTLNEEHRRAYGIPIRTPDENPATNNYAIVRSVAVTAPIESLCADERHRLGILFLLDEEKDLNLLLKQRIAETRTDEKRQLSGLMNHGIDSLARILKNRITKKNNSNSEVDVFETWLSGYLSERIQLLAWTLENWGSTPSQTDQRIIEQKTVKLTLSKYNEIFRIASTDRLLREQLHWNNGVVSLAQSSNIEDVISITVDWNEESCFSVPRDGVFGFFVSEVLINAARHGKPGSQIQVEIENNLLRNELTFCVRNEIGAPRQPNINPSIKPFGGTVIMDELARMCGWSQPTSHSTDNEYIVKWSIPAIQRKAQGHGD